MSNLVAYDFDNGSDGASMTSALISPLTVATSTAGQFSSTNHYTGTLSGHVNVTAGSTYAMAYALGSASVTVGWRIYGWIGAYPSAGAYIVSFLKSGTRVGDCRINADGTISVRNFNTAVASSTNPVGLSGWFRLEVLATAGTSIGAKLFLGGNVQGSTADETISGALAGTNIDTTRMGLLIAGPAINYYLDGLAIDNAAYPGPEQIPVSVNFNFKAPTYNVKWGTANSFTAPTGTGDLGSESFGAKATDGAQVTSALLDLMTCPIPGGAGTFSSAHPARGALGVRVNTASAAYQLLFTPPVPKPSLYSRWYGYQPALPGVAYTMAQWTLSGVQVAALRQTVTGAVVLLDATNTVLATSTTLLPAGSLWRLETKVTGGTEIRCRLFVASNVDGATQDQEIVGTIAGTNTDQMGVGVVTPSSQNVFLDAAQFNDTTWVGPAASVGGGNNGAFTWVAPTYDLQTPAVTVGNSGGFTWVAPHYALDGTNVAAWAGQQQSGAINGGFTFSAPTYAIAGPLQAWLGQIVGPPPPPPPPPPLPFPPGIVEGEAFLLLVNHTDDAVNITSGGLMKAGDLEPDLVGNVIIRDTGKPQDLSLATSVTFNMTNAATGALQVSNQASITNPQTGEITYQWNPGDTAVVGRYHGEFVVQWPNARPQTFPTVGTFDIVIDQALN